jgi:hypothetical protein
LGKTTRHIQLSGTTRERLMLQHAPAHKKQHVAIFWYCARPIEVAVASSVELGIVLHDQRVLITVTKCCPPRGLVTQPHSIFTE